MDARLHIEAIGADAGLAAVAIFGGKRAFHRRVHIGVVEDDEGRISAKLHRRLLDRRRALAKQQPPHFGRPGEAELRSEEHTSELQSLMRISYAVFCLKKKKNTQH